MSKDMRQLADRAARQGWVVTHARSGHLHWRAPGGDVIYSALTPHARGMQAHLRLMRKAGYRP